MGNGYRVPKDIEDVIRDLQRQINQLRSTSPTSSAIIRAEDGLTVYDPDTGVRMQLAGGQIKVWWDYEGHPDDFAQLYTNALGAVALAAPDGGAVFLNSLGVDELGNSGSVFIQSSGLINLNTVDDITIAAGVGSGDVLQLTGTTIQNNADTITLTAATVLQLFGAAVKVNYGSTGSAANCVLAVDGTILRSTSSQRYKQDIEDAVIDPADVLKIQGRTWRQRSDVEVDPDTKRRYVGFVAEELDALATMRQFVNYDEEGRPDSIETDRIQVALLELAKSQQEQIDTLTTQNEDLIRRLEALEARP